MTYSAPTGGRVVLAGAAAAQGTVRGGEDSLDRPRCSEGAADHGRLKSRLRSMRGLKQLCCAQVISAGRAFRQNIRRGHYELGTEEVVNLRVRAAFDELALAI